VASGNGDITFVAQLAVLSGARLMGMAGGGWVGETGLEVNEKWVWVMDRRWKLESENIWLTYCVQAKSTQASKQWRLDYFFAFLPGPFAMTLISSITEGTVLNDH
jgi:hypothetical protein